ncbi:hypothetical protein M404DRAFT_31968 [Pisolithus tinctorius Marx 270]|uniref:Uncharacterized protein n=1 Tax=Pisolithus tinctorius Marx 270 TaxID=870435 RepID=A0A0C3N9L2_PISTI|nr:hypothetical protein M404DRAFT_31968 [Pisolithus tinctorius Marx 270]
MAVKLKNFGAWEHSMEEGGMNEFGVKKAKPLSERNTRVAIFVLPTLFLYHIYHLVNIAVIVTRVLLNKDSYMETVNQSPHFAGIIAGSMTWVGYAWLTRLVTQPPNHPFIHLAFALNMGLFNDGEFKAIIKDLALEGRLNGQTFCIQCMFFWSHNSGKLLASLQLSRCRGRYGSMGGRGGLVAGSGATGIQMGHRHHHTVDNDRGDEESEAPGTCGAFLLNLVGLDRFTRGRAAHGLALGSSSARAQNPFDLGLVCNCRDFWTMGKEVGVDYGQVYDVPPEGLEEGKRKRDAEWGEFECDHDSGSRSESLLAK